ncbi:MAG: hypothetical protein KJ879_01950 [Nanoarchaeota archaeon]|nr:hypothetical protein [Nanoarchaeota archaeon]
MVKEGDIQILGQLVRTLESAFVRLKEAYGKEDSETFNKMKREVILTQRRILGLIER